MFLIHKYLKIKCSRAEVAMNTNRIYAGAFRARPSVKMGSGAP